MDEARPSRPTTTAPAASRSSRPRRGRGARGPPGGGALDAQEPAVLARPELLALREKHASWAYDAEDVLSVDDSPTIRLCFKGFFSEVRVRRADGRKRRLTYAFAESGAQALELVCGARAGGARARAFGLILMDKEMPEMDGVATTRRLRAAGYEGLNIAPPALRSATAPTSPRGADLCAAGGDVWAIPLLSAPIRPNCGDAMSTSRAAQEPQFGQHACRRRRRRGRRGLLGAHVALDALQRLLDLRDARVELCALGRRARVRGRLLPRAFGAVVLHLVQDAERPDAVNEALADEVGPGCDGLLLLEGLDLHPAVAREPDRHRLALAVLHLPDRGAHVPERARVLRALLERAGNRLGDRFNKEDAQFEKGNRSSEGPS